MVGMKGCAQDPKSILTPSTSLAPGLDSEGSHLHSFEKVHQPRKRAQELLPVSQKQMQGPDSSESERGPAAPAKSLDKKPLNQNHPLPKLLPGSGLTKVCEDKRLLFKAVEFQYCIKLKLVGFKISSAFSISFIHVSNLSLALKMYWFLQVMWSNSPP